MEKSMIKPFIAKRVAQEFTDGMVVNLGMACRCCAPTICPRAFMLPFIASLV